MFTKKKKLYFLQVVLPQKTCHISVQNCFKDEIPQQKINIKLVPRIKGNEIWSGYISDFCSKKINIIFIIVM